MKQVGLYIRQLVIFLTAIVSLHAFNAKANNIPAPQLASVDESIESATDHLSEGEYIDEDEDFGTEPMFARIGPKPVQIGKSTYATKSGAGAPSVMTGAALQQQFSFYSDTEKVNLLISSAREHIANNPNRYIRVVRGRRKTLCYRSVKDALHAADLVSASFTGGVYARDGVQELAPEGFINLLDDPRFGIYLQDQPAMAPRGAILVYRTASGAHANIAGHIEIKTADAGVDGYISVSEADEPTYGYPIPAVRQLIGVLIRPMSTPAE